MTLPAHDIERRSAALWIAFLAVSWLPLVLYTLACLYVQRFEGWGQWAAARLLLIPLGLSLIMLLLGCGFFLSDLRQGRKAAITAIATLIAGAPLLWILLRALLR